MQNVALSAFFSRINVLVFLTAHHMVRGTGKINSHLPGHGLVLSFSIYRPDEKKDVHRSMA
jgi:hypothetical protein